MELYSHSITTILAHQHAGGAYVASPNFDTYAYSWFRDGSFIAYAMGRVGQHASAAAFHRWAGLVLRNYDGKLAALTARQLRGEPIGHAEQMHTRFTLDGFESDADWTNYQLDGFGTWLWALAEHLRLTGDTALYAELRPQVQRLVAYLSAFWSGPCYDCWEEFGGQVHTATLAALYGGLRATGSYDPQLDTSAAHAISAFVRENCVYAGSLVKYVGSREVDASLLGAATPYGLLAADDPLMQRTVERIAGELRRGGGICRYLDDTYYGGGAWLLLTAWLGWHDAEIGQLGPAHELLGWVRAQASPAGDLPEQVSAELLAPAHYAPWVERWGQIASPLLWSHAMFLILNDALAVSHSAESRR